jgi:hypothetical protein
MVYRHRRWQASAASGMLTALQFFPGGEGPADRR